MPDLLGLPRSIISQILSHLGTKSLCNLKAASKQYTSGLDFHRIDNVAACIGNMEHIQQMLRFGQQAHVSRMTINISEHLDCYVSNTFNVVMPSVRILSLRFNGLDERFSWSKTWMRFGKFYARCMISDLYENFPNVEEFTLAQNARSEWKYRYIVLQYPESLECPWILTKLKVFLKDMLPLVLFRRLLKSSTFLEEVDVNESAKSVLDLCGNKTRRLIISAPFGALWMVGTDVTTATQIVAEDHDFDCCTLKNLTISANDLEVKFVNFHDTWTCHSLTNISMLKLRSLKNIGGKWSFVIHCVCKYFPNVEILWLVSYVNECGRRDHFLREWLPPLHALKKLRKLMLISFSEDSGTPIDESADYVIWWYPV